MNIWWNNAGLGMMVHFGAYSVLAGEYKGQKMDYIGEWIQAKCRIPNKEYTEIAKTFNPNKFDADLWIKTASEAGVKYIIFTTKHHEGFCNFKTDYSDFNLWNYQKRDLVKELSLACQKYNVKLGLYYSHCLDWHEKHAGGCLKKDLNYGMSWGNDWDYPNNDEKDFDKYLNEKAIPQIKELLTNYGDVALMWFDCPMDMTPERAKLVYDTVKSIQPDCLVNSRNCENPNLYSDYYGLGDNSVACSVTDDTRESIITLNDTWGYKYFDNNWKSLDTVIDILTQCTCVNTNMAINVGPKPDGTWPEETIDIFKGLANWMNINKESIHNNNGVKAPVNCEDYLVSQNKNKLYIHFMKDVSSAEMVHLKSKITTYRVLGNLYNAEISQEQEPTGIILTKITCKGKTKHTVIELSFSEEPKFSNDIIEQNSQIVLKASDAEINIFGNENTDTNNIIGPAGEKYDTKININEQGILVNWYDINNYLTWDFIAREKGTYKATLITSAVYHMGNWYDGHSVNLELNNKKFQDKEIINNGFIKEAGEIYKQAKSDLGEITIDSIEKNTINLKANKIVKENTPGLAVVKLILEKI